MTVQTRLWLSYSITFIFFCIVLIIESNTSKKIRLSAQWVTHTHQVLEATD